MQVSERQPHMQQRTTLTLGEQFVASDAFKNYQGRGTSGVLELRDAFNFRAAGDPIATTVAPGKDLLPAPQKFYSESRFAPFPLLDMVGKVMVSSGTVEWVTIADSSGADVVAEMALKPPVTWANTQSIYTLQTIAGWVKYTRQAAQDIPALVDLIDSKIRRAISIKLNTLAVAAVNGAKSSGNTTTGASKAPVEEVIRLAMAAAEARGYPVTGILVNPADRAKVDLAIMKASLTGAVAQTSVFGVPVVSSTDVKAGEVIVGDIESAITFFYRTGVSIYTTDSDVSDTGTAGAAQSDFRRNILTTLGEVRGVFAATDASALQFGVVTP
jgi:hypothetical protein